MFPYEKIMPSLEVEPETFTKVLYIYIYKKKKNYDLLTPSSSTRPYGSGRQS